MKKENVRKASVKGPQLRGAEVPVVARWRGGIHDEGWDNIGGGGRLWKGDGRRRVVNVWLVKLRRFG
jgi:hypothetical protein